MELFEALRTRRCYRGRYEAAPVPRGDLRQIMEAALAAPSGCNKQTVSVIAVDDPELLARMGPLLRWGHFSEAPAAVCILTNKAIAYGNGCFYVQDYAAAIENALLAITALGYESCWVEGDLVEEDHAGRRIADILGVPEDMELVAYLPVGRAAEAGKRVQKLPFEERAWFNGYRKP